jgi:hypothetical protein
MEAVHSALREAFKILPGDRNVRLLVHEPHRFDCPPARTSPELYTHISIVTCDFLWLSRAAICESLPPVFAHSAT